MADILAESFDADVMIKNETARKQYLDDVLKGYKQIKASSFKIGSFRCVHRLNRFFEWMSMKEKTDIHSALHSAYEEGFFDWLCEMTLKELSVKFMRGV